MGFVTAATIASFYQWITSERADFAIPSARPIRLVVAILLSMFGGPFIVMRKVVTALRAREITAIPALLGVLVAGMWSICAGIFYVSLLVGA